eukprot:CAMPEP_0170474276 /NCGR_PEP_ID=MMETSP0123-20130129/16065_1 /TAXON_ID=182087 /ORGANISM="Favella ehrenbergii, Strain Fehren 1" /LENGTH=60 /DNA_ID=CAMNT_0010743901 /DNA_START=653 /DNA_END=835 /DNA_ORIENTATION=+
MVVSAMSVASPYSCRIHASATYAAREPLLFVLQMDLDETCQDFIKVMAASYLSDGDSEAD